MRRAVRQRRTVLQVQQDIRWAEIKGQMNMLIKFGTNKAKAAALKASFTQINDWVQTRYGNVLLHTYNAEHTACVYETSHLRRGHFLRIKQTQGIISITLYPIHSDSHLRFLVMQSDGTASITARAPSTHGHLLLSTYGGMVQQVRFVFSRLQAKTRITVNAEPYRETIMRAVCRAFLEEYPRDTEDPPTPARM